MQEESVQPQDPGASEKPVEQQLAEALATVEQQREAMMRALADAENARKRAQADVAAAHKYGLERFAENLLPVMDSLEAALSSEKASPEALREGVELVEQWMSHPSAAPLVQLAHARALREDWVNSWELEPLYLRKPDAEINWSTRHGEANP